MTRHSPLSLAFAYSHYKDCVKMPFSDLPERHWKNTEQSHRLMLAGFLILSAFYLLGMLLCALSDLSIPPAILGLVGLLFFLLVRGQLPMSLMKITAPLLTLMPLFLIPASVKIIEFGPLVQQDGLLLLIAMVFSIVLSLATVPFIFLFFIRLFHKGKDPS